MPRRGFRHHFIRFGASRERERVEEEKKRSNHETHEKTRKEDRKRLENGRWSVVFCLFSCLFVCFVVLFSSHACHNRSGGYAFPLDLDAACTDYLVGQPQNVDGPI